MVKNSWKVRNPVIKMLIRCGHFDIWGSWDLQVNWKNVTTLISESWILMGEKSKVQIKAPLIHLTSPRNPCTPQNIIKHPINISFVPQEQPSPLPSTPLAVREAFVWSRVVRGTLGEMRLPDDICWVSGMFVSAFRNALGMSVLIWGCMGVF